MALLPPSPHPAGGAGEDPDARSHARGALPADPSASPFSPANWAWARVGWARVARFPTRLLVWLSARSFSPPWLPARWWHPLTRYGAAVVLAALAALLEFWLALAFPAFSAHAALALLVVVLVALLFGSGPSLVAVMVSAGLLWYLALPPQVSWRLASMDDRVSVALLAAAGLALSLLASRNERARRTAVAAAQARDTFLALAAHELRTPLTVVKTNLHMARRRVRRALAWARARDQEEVAAMAALDAALARAETAGLRQERLINDLLDVGRLQTGTLALHIARCDLGAVVRHAVAEQRQTRPQRTLHLDLPPGPVWVLADSERLGQVVVNYLTNALKYAPEDAPVEVTLSASEGTARVAVRDQGPGLAPAEQARVWELYHRAPGVRVVSGSEVGLGLGLYLCRAIVQAHPGGQVGVDSAEGAGSTFWFTLPLAAPTVTQER